MTEPTDTIGDDIALHLGDCLPVLRGMPDGAVGLVVTSPPYNLAKSASGGGSITNTHLRDCYEEWYADEMPEAEYRAWQTEVVRECLRVSRGGVFYNHKPRYAWHGRNEYRCPANVYHPWDWLAQFPVWCEIVWDRGGVGSPNAGRYPIADERIYQLGRPRVWRHCGWSNVWRVPPERGVDHPCPFPVEIPRRCILPHTDPGDTVLDPFMGSGSTGLACQRLGRKFVGIESDPAHYATARRRLVAGTGAGEGQLFAGLENI